MNEAKRRMAALSCLAITASIAFGLLHQGLVWAHTGTPYDVFSDPGSGSSENQNDPGYTVYRQAYSLILDEKWVEARKKFADLLSKYPKSEYTDDAQYWSAFALKHLDRARAAATYREFIEHYPKSKYWDDAVADMNDLDLPNVAPHAVVSPSADPIPAISVITRAVTVPNIRNLERQVRRQTLHLQMTGFAGKPMIAPFPTPETENLDPQTRIKMDALYALGETREDEKSFQTLRSVALNQHQPQALREAAMDALSHFKKFDVLPVFMEIAGKDTNEDLQTVAVDFISEHGSDKNHSITVLIDLFNTLPKQRTDQREAIFYSIADIGNDKAVDFLTSVALTNEDYNLRRDAVYYLGNIGGDKAREALYQILQDK